MSDEIVRNRIRELKTFQSRDHAIMVGSYIHWFKNNDLDLNPSYQRPYVWKQKEQDAFMKTLITGFPCGIIAILNREIKPSPLAVELYRLNATPEDAAKDYGNEL